MKEGTRRDPVLSRSRVNARRNAAGGSGDERSSAGWAPWQPGGDRKTHELSRSVPQWADVRRMSYDPHKGSDASRQISSHNAAPTDITALSSLLNRYFRLSMTPARTFVWSRPCTLLAPLARRARDA